MLRIYKNCCILYIKTSLFFLSRTANLLLFESCSGCNCRDYKKKYIKINNTLHISKLGIMLHDGEQHNKLRGDIETIFTTTGTVQEKLIDTRGVLISLVRVYEMQDLWHQVSLRLPMLILALIPLTFFIR